MQLFRTKVKTQVVFSEVSPYESKEYLRKKVETLMDDERAVFKWMMRYFSDSWIAETLMISKKRLKELQQVVFLKLGVRNKQNLLRVYDGLKPENDGPPDVNEIDAYIEKRTEREIRNSLEFEKQYDEKATQMQQT